MDIEHCPTTREMRRAFERRDAGYDGLFFVGVKTTGIFCRPTCPARRPKPENIEFFASTADAELAGYRACKRCKPLIRPNETPEWLTPLMSAVDTDPARRWRDRDIRALEIDPVRVRRWFLSNHGQTFHAWVRARRVSMAMERIKQGEAVTNAAFDHGYDSLSGFNEAFQKLLGIQPSSAARAKPLFVDRVNTPLGPMLAGAVDEGLCLLEFTHRRMLERQLKTVVRRLQAIPTPGQHEHLSKVQSELDAYFAGDLQAFKTPVHAPGTEFQDHVWRALLEIPFGETESYSQLAARIGKPSARRAVAQANGMNRVAVLIPCHRVIGENGRLTGYGGGLRRKEFLLRLERKAAGLPAVDLFG